MVEAIKGKEEEEDPTQLDVRLFFALGRQEPRGSAENSDDDEADEGCPSAGASVWR